MKETSSKYRKPTWGELCGRRWGTEVNAFMGVFCRNDKPALSVAWRVDGSRLWMSQQAPVNGIIKLRNVITVVRKSVAILTSQDGHVADPGIDPMVHPEWLRVRADEPVVMQGEWAGRKCWRAMLSRGVSAEQVEICFDGETGVVLRIASAGRGRWFSEFNVMHWLPDSRFEWAGPVAGVSQAGCVWVADELDGTCSAYWQEGDFYADGPEGVSLAMALSWAREKAEVVILRWKGRQYNAGDRMVGALPVWGEGT